MSPKLKVWLHSLAAAAISAGSTALIAAAHSGFQFDRGHLLGYAEVAASAATLAVLALLAKSPLWQ